MAKRKEEKAEETPAENPEEETPPPEPEPKTYSEEEKEAELKKKLDEQYKKLNTSLTRLGDENKRLREQATQPSGYNVDAMDGIVQDLEARDAEMGVTSPRLGQVKRVIAEEKQRQDYQKRQREWETHCGEEESKIASKLLEAGVDLNSYEGIGIRESIEVATKGTGNFKFANEKADALIRQVKAKGKQAESEAEEEGEEANRKKLEEEGKLISSVSKPSGTGRSFKEKEEAYNKGQIPYSEYLEARKREGLA